MIFNISDKDLLETVSDINRDTTSLRDISRLALASALMSLIPVRSIGNNSSVRTHYLVNIQPDIDRLLGNINEYVIVDYTKVDDYAYIFFSTKYNVMFPRRTVLQVRSQETAVADVLVGQNSIPLDLAKLITEDYKEYERHHNRWVKLLENIIAKKYEKESEFYKWISDYTGEVYA